VACWNFIRSHCSEGIEHVFSRHRPEPRLRGGLWLADCAALLQQARPERARVSDLRNSGADCVVLAAGVWTDTLLEANGLAPLGVRPLPGTAVLGTGQLQVPLTYAYRLPGDTRTRTATARPWAGGVRVGDTAGLEEQMPVLRGLLQHLGSHETGTVSGLRPGLPQLFVAQVAPRIIVATGGHRSGLATAPGVALRVLELLRERGREGTEEHARDGYRL
jgi:glycine/D-amino acid oxidase-like deaminating enzyme